MAERFGPNHLADWLQVKPEGKKWALFERLRSYQSADVRWTDRTFVEQAQIYALFHIINGPDAVVAVLGEQAVAESFLAEMGDLVLTANTLGGIQVRGMLRIGTSTIRIRNKLSRRIQIASEPEHVVGFWDAKDMLIIDLQAADSAVKIHDLREAFSQLRPFLLAEIRMW